ncbi:MAG: hypothetical protein GX594_15290 [Pirellulaceae bacterium]|nr:hypothetical protein [Pirellulaceae bacterium]
MSILVGGSLAVLAGLMQGAFPLPMKFAQKWKWENIWSVFALWGFVVLPWLLAFITVPNLMGVYAATSAKALAAVTLFGLGWGIGTICFGIGVSMVGMALAFAIIIGTTAALGTLVPLVQNIESLKTFGGMAIAGGVVLMVLGIVLCALAGHLKQKQLAGGSETPTADGKSFGKGLAVCILGGVTSPMLNFAFSFGEEIVENAKTAGAANVNASNPIWCWTMTCAFLATAIYCLFLMSKDRGWKRFSSPGTAKNWGLTFLMGALWSGNIAVYGVALSQLGTLAASIGWSFVMITTIVMGNVLGIATGEWKGAGGKPFTTMLAGLALLIAAVCLIAVGNA